MDRGTGVICDQTIALGGLYTQQAYAKHLRRIRFKDAVGLCSERWSNQWGSAAPTGKPNKKPPLRVVLLFGVPTGIRTPVTAVKGL